MAYAKVMILIPKLKAILGVAEMKVIENVRKAQSIHVHEMNWRCAIAYGMILPTSSDEP